VAAVTLSHGSGAARELETCSDLLPFRVEVTDVGGSKVYRSVGAR
jgi:hypothetical protein